MARRMRGLIGCLVAASAVVASTAAVAADGPSVRQVSGATWNEAAGVSTMAELRAASAKAQRLVVTPTVEVVAARSRVPGKSGWVGLGPRRLPPGCHDVSLSTTQLNVFGAVVMQSTTTVRNWCHDGARITSSPTVQRSSLARWGWSACGWDSDYGGWLHTATRFGAGGAALFAHGDSCAGAQAQSQHDVQVHGNGTANVSY